MPRDSNSQKQAAHNRWHRDKSVVKSNCDICRSEHPELGEVCLNPTPTVEIVAGTNNNPIATVIVRPVLQASNPLADITEQLEKDRLYGWAAVNRSIEEAATAFGCSVECFTEKISKLFGVTWEQLSARAFSECSFQVMSNLFARAAGGDSRFAFLYLKLVESLNLDRNRFSPRMMERTTMPVRLETDFRKMSSVDLEFRRQELARVVDRKPTFTPGPMRETLTCVPTDLLEPRQDLPRTINSPKKVEQAPEFELESEKLEPPAQVTQPTTYTPGPVTYNPKPGLLELGRR